MVFEVMTRSLLGSRALMESVIYFVNSIFLESIVSKLCIHGLCKVVLGIFSCIYSLIYG